MSKNDQPTERKGGFFGKVRNLAVSARLIELDDDEKFEIAPEPTETAVRSVTPRGAATKLGAPQLSTTPFVARRPVVSSTAVEVQSTPETRNFLDKALSKAGLKGFIAFVTLYRKMCSKSMDQSTAVTAALTAIEDVAPREQLVQDLQRLEGVLSAEKQAFESKLQAAVEVEIQKVGAQQEEARQGIEARQKQIQQLLTEVQALEKIDKDAEESIARQQRNLELTMGEFNASVEDLQREVQPLRRELDVV